MLRDEEYEVIGEARNGIAAVDSTDRLKPDIVCLDVIMPKKDGLTALCEIKAARPETEVVMITSNAAPETVQKLIQNSASGSSSNHSMPPASSIPWR
ncbi:MAG: response regulator [Azonexus sp.]|nr:response regulator [Azonexus sp.]MDZ4315910.1 response regulator [Azonexus sp.]